MWRFHVFLQEYTVGYFTYNTLYSCINDDFQHLRLNPE